MPLRWYIAQRLTALAMAPLVVIHLGVMIYAANTGLSAEAILQRTRGSLVWATVYELFVLAAAVHAAAGLRAVLSETVASDALASRLAVLFALPLLALGSFAVYAVVGS